MSELKSCEAIEILENGDWWCWLSSELDSESEPSTDLHNAIDTAIAALRRAQPDNEPLTLEELRGMDGEPVYLKDGIGEGWFLTGAIAGTKLYFYEKSITVGEPLSGCGKTWIAHRHKPERSDNNGPTI